jgi:NIPSNAP
MKKMLLAFVFTIVLTLSISQVAKAIPREYYLIQIYHCSSQKQIEHIDVFMKSTYLPYLHETGIAKVGVFTPIDNDTAADKKLYVWIPLKSIDEVENLDQKIEKIDPMGFEGIIHLENADSSLPYNRVETILTKAFKGQPQYEKKTTLVKEKNDARIYEYRSYESATEDMHLRKVHMFNEGKEIGLFARLNFNAIFYSKVIAGSRMPNLIYMTSFKNIADRDAHWKAFGDDAYWKKISNAPEYLKTVSKADIILMKAKDYADF